MYRQMVKVLQTDDYFHPEQLNSLRNVISHQRFSDTDLGQEILNFNLVQPGVEDVLSDVVGERLFVDESQSGIFRKPDITIHFEGFDHPNEWCFAVALERSTFNIYYHLSGARNALEGYKFNYRNFLEWDYHTNILLEPNQGIFFRPWIFHSFSGGIMHHYRLKSAMVSSQKKLILVMGLPGSGKTELSEQLAKELNASHINSDTVRTMYNDFNYGIESEVYHARRLRRLSMISELDYSIVDSTSPRISCRDVMVPDYIIWMDTVQSSKYSEADEIFEPPTRYNIRITSTDYSVDDILKEIRTDL
jgi:hypothetical protein